MKTVNPNFNSHIEKGTIEINNEYYNLLEEKMARLINQNKKLKKQVEERTKMYQNAYDYSQKMEGKTIILLNQQKEFIKYMRELSNWYSADGVKQGLVNGILQKYKEIIGVSDENNIK